MYKAFGHIVSYMTWKERKIPDCATSALPLETAGELGLVEFSFKKSKKIYMSWFSLKCTKQLHETN